MTLRRFSITYSKVKIVDLRDTPLSNSSTLQQKTTRRSRLRRKILHILPCLKSPMIWTLATSLTYRGVSRLRSREQTHIPPASLLLLLSLKPSMQPHLLGTFSYYKGSFAVLGRIIQSMPSRWQTMRHHGLDLHPYMLPVVEVILRLHSGVCVSSQVGGSCIYRAYTSDYRVWSDDRFGRQRRRSTRVPAFILVGLLLTS